MIYSSVENSFNDILKMFNNVNFENDLNMKKIYNLNFTIKNPRYNLIKHQTRNIDYKLLIAELLYNLEGKNDVESIKYYNKNYEKLSEDGETINGMIGNRIFYYDGLFDIYKDDKKDENGNLSNEIVCEHIVLNQWEKCIDALTYGYKFNINIFNPILDNNSLQTSPISNLFFYIIDNKLNLTANILELDFYARYPYISFILSTLLSIMANKLSLKLGVLNFNCNLLFTFCDKFDIINNKYNNKLEDNGLSDNNIFTTIFDLELLSRVHGNLINIEDSKNKIKSINNKYWMSLISCLIKFNTELNDFDEFIIDEHKYYFL